MPELLIISHQQRWYSDLCENHIQITIVIDVCKGRAATHHWLEQIRASLFRWHGNESACVARSGVPKELRGLFVLLTFLDLINFIFEMAVGGEHVEAAIQVVIKEEHAEFERQAADRADAFSDGFIREQRQGVWFRRSLRNVERGHFIGKVADDNAEIYIVAEPSSIDAHGPSCLAIGIESDTCQRADFLEHSVLL